MAAPETKKGITEEQQQELDDAIMEATRANPKKVPLVLRAWMET